MTVPVAGETIATITSYPELVEAFRIIKMRLGLSNDWCDETCDFSKGFTDKVLGPTQTKTVSALTFSMFCQIFAVKFRMEIDLDAVTKMEAVWEKRAERNVRAIETRISKKLIERAKPHVLKAAAKHANAARNAKLTSEVRIKIAKKAGRKGAKARRVKMTTEQRQHVAKLAAEARWAARRADS